VVKAPICLLFSSAKRIFLPLALVLANLTMGETSNAPLKVRLSVDLTPDTGQSYGTLWEATNDQGRPVAGAGFLNAYNTQDRTDRRLLQVYVRTSGDDTLTVEELPRPTSDAGTYLFGFDGKLFAKGRSSRTDKKLRVWRPEAGRWEEDTITVPFSVHVADDVLAVASQRVTHGNRTVLELTPDQGSLGEWYYAAGALILRRYHGQAEPPINELIAFDWKPEQQGPFALTQGIKLPLSQPREFIYAFGQQGDEIILVSNLGGVHVFRSGKWKTACEPGERSFQVYSTLNTADRLLLGQYPTGELFEFTEGELRRLPGWPPVMTGVSANAREAQTLAIFGGDIYVGVWPWGEIWRWSGADHQWRFERRMFTHPEPTDKTIHPYEAETKLLDPVVNRWGQRVTSMVPLGDSLFISTSAKQPPPYEPKFTFLAGDKHLEYGAVYRCRKPGCLAVPMRWTNGPTTLEFRIEPRRIEVRQDGKHLGATEWDAQHIAQLKNLQVRHGSGIFGPFRGKEIQDLSSHDSAEDQTWVELDGKIYGAKPDALGPIGGGEGYANIVTRGDFTATNLDSLLDALAKAQAGQTVFIPGETEIDMTVRIYIEQLVLEVPEGVTLAGDRGNQGSRGALLTSDALKTPAMIRAAGPDVRITGLRIRGPNPKRQMEHHKRAFGPGGAGSEYYYKFPTSSGITTQFPRLQVDNCEISAFGLAGIVPYKGEGHHFHHNFIHHCQYNGLGYGICNETASSLIEYNLFDYNRHSIAGTGKPGCSYIARHNIELGVSLSHCFDMHGGRDRKDGTDIAGTAIEIYNNTFRAPQTPVVIRGVPEEKCEIHHNWFVKHDGPEKAVDAAAKIKVQNNCYGEKSATAK